MQSSQSSTSAAVPLAYTASEGLTRTPLAPQMVASGPLRRAAATAAAFTVGLMLLLAMLTAMVCRMIFLACSTTSAGSSSYFSPAA